MNLLPRLDVLAVVWPPAALQVIHAIHMYGMKNL